jgi:hypothetical protein
LDVYITSGSPADLGGVLSKKFGFKVHELDALSVLKLNPEAGASPPPGRLEAAAGLALGAASGRKLINLEERKEKTAARESPVLSACLAVLIVLLLFSSFFMRLREKERRLLEIRDRISLAVEQSFGAPELSARSGMEIISILKERTRLRGGLADALRETGSDEVLDVLRELAVRLPGRENLTVTGIRIDGGVCYLDGRADSFRGVEEVFGGITGSEYFSGARIARAQADSESGGVVFRIEISLPGGG